MGLDIACMVSDLILRNNTKMNKSKNSINKGYVNSLILQVGYLLFYDAIFLIKLKKVLIKTKSKKDNSTLQFWILIDVTYCKIVLYEFNK